MAEGNTKLSELFFKEGKDGLIDFSRGFPHGDMAAFLDHLKFRPFDGPMEFLSHRGRKKQISFSPEEKGGLVNP